MARNSLKNICRLIQETFEQVSPEQSFLADLKRSIELTDKANRREPSKTYKPSSMHCIRNMYYQRTGAAMDDGESSYTLVGIRNAGTDIHARIQKAVMGMQDNGIDCEYVNVGDYVRTHLLDGSIEIVKEADPENGDYETKLFNRDYNISFLCDGIIRYKGKYYILEIKTESSGKFMMRKGVDPKHYDQGTAYTLSLCVGISDVIFLYVNRDVLDMKSYLFTTTEEMREGITDKIQTCEQMIADGKVPPKPSELPKSVCEFCNYKTVCRRDTNG